MNNKHKIGDVIAVLKQSYPAIRINSHGAVVASTKERVVRVDNPSLWNRKPFKIIKYD